jgi:hypothetical protein
MTGDPFFPSKLSGLLIERSVVIYVRGAPVASRLANLWPERHLGTVFIALPYSPPDPSSRGGEAIIQFAKEQIGVDLFSYWKFFASDEAARIISEHVIISICSDAGNVNADTAGLTRKSRFTASCSPLSLHFGGAMFRPRGHWKSGC